MQMGTCLIKNGRVWDGEEFFDADVLTKEDTVIAISKNISEPADFVYDAADKIVSAGLVDAHMHMRGFSCAEHGTPVEASCFPFGVTAAAEAGAINGTKEMLDSLLVKNRVFVPVGFENNKPDFENVNNYLLKQYGDKGIGLKVCFDTTQYDIRTIDPLKEVSAFAKKRGLKVLVHSSNSPVPMCEIADALNPGDILTHAFHGGKHNAAEDGFACIRLAKERGVYVDVGMAGFVHTDFAIFKAAIEAAALPDLIGTDLTRLSAFKRGGRYGMTMCMSIAKALGMGEKEIFKAVTATPARALGMERECDSLTVGGCADIAVFGYGDAPFDLTDRAGNRIVGTKGYQCDLTLASGEVVYRS